MHVLKLFFLLCISNFEMLLLKVAKFIIFKLLQFEDDAVLIPRETAWFGYYPDGAFSPVLPPQEVIVPPCTVMS